MAGVEKASIADEDVPGWIEALKQGGDMTQEEIDFMLSNLNKSYARALNPNWMEDEIDQIDRFYFHHTKKRLTDEDKQRLRAKLAQEK